MGFVTQPEPDGNHSKHTNPNPQAGRAETVEGLAAPERPNGPAQGEGHGGDGLSPSGRALQD